MTKYMKNLYNSGSLHAKKNKNNNKYVEKMVFENSNKVADNTKAESLGLVKIIHDSAVE